MTQFLIQNGRLIDPESHRDEVTDILIEGDRIVDVGSIKPSADAAVVDAAGLWVTPLAVDLHVHLRDMDQDNKETIWAGTRAALHGGVGTVFAMPNTRPPLDSLEAIRRYQEIIGRDAMVETHVAGAIGMGLRSDMLAPLEEYPPLGIRMITNDGFDVNNEGLLEEAYLKAKELGLVVMTHPEMDSIAPFGVVNEGRISRLLGIQGQPNDKEWKAVQRGLRLAIKTGARAHFTHLSAKESVELVRQAKADSDQITCDTTPHHLCLTEELVPQLKSFAKVNPPLRTEEDRQALIAGILDGTIDCLVTDHAPHTTPEKRLNLNEAPFGFSGLEILIPATLTELCVRQNMDPLKAVSLLTTAPARIAGLKTPRISPNYPANLALLDMENQRNVDPSLFVSLGKITPFEGMPLKGWPTLVIYRGIMNQYE